MLDAVVQALQRYPEILGVVVITLTQFGMVWRRRGADHRARTRYGESSSPLYTRLFHYSFMCQLGLLALMPTRELIAVLRVYVGRC